MPSAKRYHCAPRTEAASRRRVLSRDVSRHPCRSHRTVESTAIYYLLARGNRSHWHRIDAVEVWHYYAGSPLDLQIANENCPPHSVKLGPDIAAGERPQAIVPASAWQSAETMGDWTLVGCTVCARVSNLQASNWRRRVGSRVL